MKVENVTPDAIILARSMKTYGLNYCMDRCNIEVKCIGANFEMYQSIS